MRLRLHCHFRTVPGQRLEVVAGDGTHELTWTAGHWWAGAVDVRGAYGYRLVDESGPVAREQGPPHAPPPGVAEGDVVVDRWQAYDPVRPARRSSLFSRALAVHHPAVPDASGGAGTGLRLRLLEPAVPVGWSPVVLPAAADAATAARAGVARLDPAPDGYPWWQGRAVDPGALADGYRYVLVGPGGEVVEGDREVRHLPPLDGGTAVVVDEALHALGGWRGAGVAVPVFALRGERSLGVGQFGDLPAFVDWAADAGLAMVQLLPLNDTIATHDWDDAYPYDPVSVQALHPLYVDVLDLPGAELVADEVETLRDELEAEDAVDYPRVMAAKWRLLRRLHDAVPRGREVAAFAATEWAWLGPYALWCVLRDRHGTPDPRRWGDDAAHAPGRVAGAREPGHPDHEEVMFHVWLQYHLRRQLDAAAAHARDRGVALKGDLPIGVSPTSVETWVHPEWFHPGTQSGAPPDDFAVDGQNWGFPTYDWEAMAADGYGWWRRRFASLARTFDAYRIDHVLGFFRIWEIPEGHRSGLLGRFRPCLPLSEAEVRGWLDDVDLEALTHPVADETDVALLAVRGGWHPRIQWWRTTAHRALRPDVRRAFDAMADHFYFTRHEHLWRGRGRMALSGVVGATDLLACGEDLGMVPPQVPEVMEDRGVLSLEIERMPKRLGAWRTDPAATPYLAVVSTGTHDMSVLRGWWAEEPEAAARLWREGLGRTGAPPVDPAPEVVQEVVAAQLASPSMLCILPVQDWLALDADLRRDDPTAERINVPSDRHHHWRYRLHLTTAQLHEADLTPRLRGLVVGAGRATG
jgi:4-alpha-glucanotransferase